ncbi:hypothetical protein [Streptomyces asoensis]|uniref:hypothetical protein n=1 Tax=Streptomyces asoensis TaxID=249586 RepID=UPI00332A1895
MTDVVDSDELLRRIRRARDCAHEELLALRARGTDSSPGGVTPSGTGVDDDPGAVPEARVRGIAYEAVLRVLDEILTPGRVSAPGDPARATAG